jgi:hypothetical protein
MLGGGESHNKIFNFYSQTPFDIFRHPLDNGLVTGILSN